ncbi:hypothetical protein EPN28_03310 [Patescibacteria group bacterium]|nr:MAG: hypothetical protein EPN28_03310 [Patescibacteria group bacterium]
MSKVKYVKQLTRENTLLDRGFRTIAYAQSIGKFGRAKIARSPIVGRGRVTSLYFDPADKKRQQKIILREFKGKNISRLGDIIVKLLIQGYNWGRKYENKNLTRKDLRSYISLFMKYHAYGRGAIVYSYWGEQSVAQRLKKLLAAKVSARELDDVLSTLSVPKAVVGLLNQLHCSSPRLIRKREDLARRLKLTAKEKELAEILSWFTYFYEMGERVSSYLYDQLLDHLRKVINNEKELAELDWYDPVSLRDYLGGKKMPESEMKRRQQFYILLISRRKLKILSGEKAQNYFKLYFEEDKTAVVDKIIGFVASKGKVRGKVKIVITREDQVKMQKGDILVSSMTTPSLITAVKKAAAIVTDEGGLTAHAAIVSRELGIPCIIGTKIATKVLKDGDMVEVDAEKGIVRKI